MTDVKLRTPRSAGGLGRALLASAFFALAATGGHAADEKVVPVIVKDQSIYYWQVVLAGAAAAGRDLGVKVVPQSGTSEQDVAGQIELLDKASKEHAAAIVLAPTHYRDLGPAVDEAAKQVPVIVIDSGVASLNMRASLATDNVAAGALAADAVATAVEKTYGKAEGEVAIVNFIDNSGSLMQRSKGFKDRLFSDHPGLTVVDERNGDGSERSVEAMVDAIIAERPTLRAIFASNIVTAAVAARAIKEGNLADKIKLLGFDSSAELSGFVTDGTVAGLIVQDPYRMGYDGVKTALDAAERKGVLQFADTGATLITKDNINGPTEVRLLNPPIN